MALRRPPTRIELKTDDIKEYEQYKNERLFAESDSKFNSNSIGREGADGTTTTTEMSSRRRVRIVNQHPSRGSSTAGRTTNVGGTTSSRGASTAAERIGVVSRR